MTDAIKIFENKEFGKVKISTVDGKIMFGASDVAKALGYAKPADAVSAHCKGVIVLQTPSKGGMQMTKFIPEGDVYRLIIRSKLPSAEKFERWVFDDVLPSIRKAGSYTLPKNPPSYAECLIGWGKEIKRREELESQVKQLRPKASFADAVTACKTSISVGEFAKLISKEFHIGRNRLFEKLREWNLLMCLSGEFNKPTQKAIELGIFQTEERTFKGDRLMVKAKITPKGQLYIYKRLKTMNDIWRLENVKVIHGLKSDMYVPVK